jgi:hypothetical protein
VNRGQVRGDDCDERSRDDLVDRGRERVVPRKIAVVPGLVALQVDPGDDGHALDARLAHRSDDAREQPAHQTHALLERELAGQAALRVDLLEWDEDMGLHVP